MITKVKYKGYTWIDIKNPRDKDVSFITKKFPYIHKPVLDEIIPPGHRAKVERHKDYLFMILYYPIFSNQYQTTESRELDIIVTKDHIITSHYKTIIPLKKIFDHINLYEDSKQEYMENGPGMLLYHLIAGLLDSALNKLSLLEKNIDEIEDAIFSKPDKKTVTEISLTKRDIINFRRILAPQEEVLESLYKEGVIFFGEFMIPYFEDILGYYSRVWNAIEDHRETIQALSETNDSLLNSKINEIIKILTIFSVIVFPLTLLSSIWGMNTKYTPFSESLNAPWDFWAVMLLMGILSTTMLVFFKFKKWF